MKYSSGTTTYHLSLTLFAVRLITVLCLVEGVGFQLLPLPTTFLHSATERISSHDELISSPVPSVPHDRLPLAAMEFSRAGEEDARKRHRCAWETYSSHTHTTHAANHWWVCHNRNITYSSVPHLPQLGRAPPQLA